MRDKVLAAAEALGYRPNVLARSLTTGRSRIIGLVVAYLDNQYYPVAIEKLCRALQDSGYHVLIFIAAQTAVDIDVDDVLQEIVDYQVDGIVMASVSMSSTLAQRCLEEGVPVVLFNRTQDDPRCSAVTSDNFGGGGELARFLVAGGHERIAYIAGWEGASTQKDREAGFRAGLAESGRGVFARGVGNYSFADAQLAARKMFGARNKPDAVFVANDHMAIAAMDVIRFELKLRVPDDVSVVSYDDAPQAAWPTYALTSIRQPTEAMVASVVGALLARIERDEPEPHRVKLPGRLIVRGSARIPEGWPDARV